MHTAQFLRLTALIAFVFTTGSSPATEPKKKDISAELHSKYARHITYSSPRAAQIVKSFEIDCEAPDGRYVPLLNILYVSIAAGEDKWQTKYHVENRGDNVRIIEKAYFPDGRQMQGGGLKFEINQWGELTPHLGITTEAILNTCRGSYGPIWIIPKPPKKK
jgi:hypothetical protein